MKEVLNDLYAHKSLDRHQSKIVLQNMAMGAYNEAQIASFVTVYLMRNITEDELAGFRDAILDMAVNIDLGCSDYIDVCGTGGDGKDTFNISTLSAFVIAGAGYKVVKHGNYGVSSISGSSNVLESLGYQFTTDESILRDQLNSCGLCFLHAPLFHPALKAVAGIRKQLGIKTFFNMLGPLVNPAQPGVQVAGVFNLALQRIYSALMTQSHLRFAILYDLGGYDEVSLTGDFRMTTQNGSLVLTPSDFGFTKVQPEQLYGGKSVEDGKTIFLNILRGKASPQQKSVVVANAAIGILTLNPELTLSQAIEEANASLENGKAEYVLTQLLKAG